MPKIRITAEFEVDYFKLLNLFGFIAQEDNKNLLIEWLENSLTEYSGYDYFPEGTLEYNIIKLEGVKIE